MSGAAAVIHLYDGNNVMLRAAHKPQLGAARPLSMRMRYEHACMAAVGSQIWCWDGRDHNTMRQATYPRYKTNREPQAENIFAQIKLWKDLLKLSPATQITVEGWEADDVIGTIARRLAASGISCTIHTNDMDYAQLDHFPTVTLNGVNTKGVPARWVCLYKAMVGDSSDYIAGIPGFGPGAWEKIKDYWPQIERAIRVGNPDAFKGLPVTKGVAAWLTEQDNINLLQAMLTITHFFTVPDDELSGGISVGELNRQAANETLGKFFL